jgi:hypothetical protein
LLRKQQRAAQVLHEPEPADPFERPTNVGGPDRTRPKGGSRRTTPPGAGMARDPGALPSVPPEPDVPEDALPANERRKPGPARKAKPEAGSDKSPAVTPSVGPAKQAGNRRGRGR